MRSARDSRETARDSNSGKSKALCRTPTSIPSASVGVLGRSREGDNAKKVVEKAILNMFFFAVISDMLEQLIELDAVTAIVRVTDWATALPLRPAELYFNSRLCCSVRFQLELTL